MPRNLKRLLLVGVVLAAAGFGAAWFVHERSGGGGGETSRTADGKKSPAPENPNASDKEQSSRPVIALPAIKEHPITPGTPVGNTQDAQGAVDDVARELGLGDSSELAVGGRTDDGLGNTYYQVQQQYRGVDVYGAVSVLEVENNEAGQLYGTWVQNLDLDVEPTYDAVTALRMALTQMGVPEDREVRVPGDDPRLIIITGDQFARLCWLFQASLTNPGSLPEVFIVDAHTPEIISRRRAMQR